MDIPERLFKKVKEQLNEARMPKFKDEIIVPVYSKDTSIKGKLPEVGLSIYGQSPQTEKFTYRIENHDTGRCLAIFNQSLEVTFYETYDARGLKHPDEVIRVVTLLCEILLDYHTPNSVKFIKGLENE